MVVREESRVEVTIDSDKDLTPEELNERERMAMGAIAYIAGAIESRIFQVQGQDVRVPRELAIAVAATAYAASEQVLLNMNREQRRALAKQAVGD